MVLGELSFYVMVTNNTYVLGSVDATVISNVNNKSNINVRNLTHITPLVSLYTPWKLKKGFLMCSVGMEREPRYQMG